jgi:hypothetical protein
MGQDSFGAATIDIHLCDACGGEHEAVKLHPYAMPKPPFTHWYSCPANTDPVPLAVMNHASGPVQLHTKVIRDLVMAQLHGPMLVYIASVVNGRVIKTRHCFSFPKELYADVYGWLQEDLDKDSGVLPAPTAPLRRANLRDVLVATPPPVADAVSHAQDLNGDRDVDDYEEIDDDDPPSVSVSR